MLGLLGTKAREHDRKFHRTFSQYPIFPHFIVPMQKKGTMSHDTIGVQEGNNNKLTNQYKLVLAETQNPRDTSTRIFY